jgi:hypothetical protein
MFVDIWIVSLFSLLFGVCAYINYNMGIKKGIETTLHILEAEKVIQIDGEDIQPYRKEIS